MPPNASDALSLFRLKDWGGPSITSIKVMALASAYRAATSTVVGWEKWIELLSQEADEHLPIAHRYAAPRYKYRKGLYWPDCWDNEPIAMHLQHAVEVVRDLWAKSHAGTALSKPLTQAQCAKFLAPILNECNLPALIHKRLSEMFPPLKVELLVVNFETLRLALRKVSCHVAMTVNKTYLNGWATTKRMHDSAFLNCIFGCICSDDLQHYLLCPTLWNIVSEAMNCGTSDDLCSKLGLVDFSCMDFHLLSISFSLVHARRACLRNSCTTSNTLVRFLESDRPHCVALAKCAAGIFFRIDAGFCGVIRPPKT